VFQFLGEFSPQTCPEQAEGGAETRRKT